MLHGRYEQKQTIKLITYKAEYIVGYVDRHPICWSNADLARRNGVGDKAGCPPTPWVYEFMSLLGKDGGLFTQQEFFDHCCGEWAEWIAGMPPQYIEGLKAKAFRNFYPSLIDSLHVWSMLSDSRVFDRCEMDAIKDAVGKTDLTVYVDDRRATIALSIGTKFARRDAQYKAKWRNDGAYCTFSVKLPMARNVGKGNKRWYELGDFVQVLEFGMMGIT